MNQRQKAERFIKRISLEDIVKYSREYNEEIPRDPAYTFTTWILEEYWPKDKHELKKNIHIISDSISIFLLVWNQSFYRNNKFFFDFAKLERILTQEFDSIDAFRGRDIKSLSDKDRKDIMALFELLKDATGFKNKKNKSMHGWISSAKTLHMLAPDFFPLWDRKISKKYGFSEPHTEEYLEFCFMTRNILMEHSKRQLTLKMIDEYNMRVA